MKFCYGCMQPKQESPVCEKCGFDERTLNAHNQLPIGTVLLNQYVIGRVLGQGGFGITYMGWDRMLQMPVAIKEYFPSGLVHRDLRYGLEVECSGSDQAAFEKHRDRFLKEARTLAQLTSVPEIVQVKNFFVANNTAYIVMEYVQGITLKTYLKKLGRPMTVPEALEIMKPVIQGLSKVHDHQMVHRDVSPDNIMLPGNNTVKLIDFGTARNMDTGMRSKSTESILKPGFAPLEQYNTRGNLGTWTDVYAVCATFHYLLTGKVPPDAPTRIEDGARLPLLEQVPTMRPQVLKALQEGLEIRAQDRIQTLPQLQERLFASEKKKNKLLLPVLAAVLAVAATAVTMLKPKPPQIEQEIQKPSYVTQTTADTERAEPAQATEDADWADIYQESAAEPVTLNVVAAQYSDNSFRWWEDFEADFEEMYPNVDLVVDVVSWYDIYTVANSRIANGDAPDILNIDIYEDYQRDGLLLPVEAYMSQETYNKFYPHMLEFSAAEGKVWAVPNLCTTRALFCNMDILNAAGVSLPRNWQELEAYSILIKEYDHNIYPLGVDMTTDDGQANFLYFALNNGGGLLDDNGNWYLDREENVEALRYVTGLVQDGLTNPDPTTQTRYDLKDLFLAGRMAMMIAPDNLVSYIESSGTSMNYQIIPIPVNTLGASTSLVFADRFMAFDNDHSEAELEAIGCFFDFFYEDSRYTEWITMDGFLPVTQSGARCLGSQNPGMAVWDVILENTVFYPTWAAGWEDVRQGLIDVQHQVLLGADPADALQALQAKITG